VGGGAVERAGQAGLRRRRRDRRDRQRAPGAIGDARTESVAAPAARAAGVRTPRLLAFDDTRALVDRPWSVWERVPGMPLRARIPRAADAAAAWREVGAELALLHRAVTACSDPRGWLDRHDRAPDARASLPGWSTPVGSTPGPPPGSRPGWPRSRRGRRARSPRASSTVTPTA